MQNPSTTPGNHPKHVLRLLRLQNAFVIVAALLFVAVVLLELFDAYASFWHAAAYFLGACAYGAELVVLILRFREHSAHRAELVMPVVFGGLYLLLSFKHL